MRIRGQWRRGKPPVF